MRTVSTGVGLCVLGVCVLGAAALSTSQVGGQAFAQQQTPQPAWGRQITDQVPITLRQQFGNTDAQAATTSCQTNAASWLDHTPHVIPVCEEMSAVGMPTLYAADVNADGHLESFALNYATVASVLVNGQLTGEAVRIAHAVKSQDLRGNPNYESQLIFDSNNVLAGLRQQFPWATWMQILTNSGRAGWMDMDHDRDLDLVLFVSIWDGININSGGRVIEGVVWFENTGYQAPLPPNPYDLDQDGEVGAGDISVLLLNFD